MSFFEILQRETEQERLHLLSAPLINDSRCGKVTLNDYVAFLGQAYHHVKHTVPLLMAVGSRLPESKEWLRVAVAEYIEEELGHQEWVLNDIAACGFDKAAVRHSKPHTSTELMVSYAYDMVHRVNPLGFFGMVHVLEGTSVSVADQAANGIREALALPKSAFTYLYSHGSVDQDHVQFFQQQMDRIEAAEEQDLILQSARVFYKLYGDIFRSLKPSES